MPIKAVFSPFRFPGNRRGVVRHRLRVPGETAAQPTTQAADRSAWSWRRKSATWFQLAKVWLTNFSNTSPVARPRGMDSSCFRYPHGDKATMPHRDFFGSWVS
jgi:hypothetical protein